MKLAQQHDIIFYPTSLSTSKFRQVVVLCCPDTQSHQPGSNDGIHWACGSAFPGFENSPAGFSIMGRGEGVLGFFAIFLVSGLLELAWREDPSGEKEPGNYGDPFGVQSTMMK